MTQLIVRTNHIHHNMAYRTEQAGRVHLVVPVVAVRPGVLNRELLTLAELEHSVRAWNGQPVVVRHPEGGSGSANRPELEPLHIGRLWNAHLEGDGLKGEMWLDVARCESLGGDYLAVLERLEAGEATEVSTGYWRDLEPQAGMHDGKSYSGVQRNLLPDHLAILPDEVGACSWRDGCGAPRLNREERPMKVTKNELVEVEVALYLSDGDAAALAMEGGRPAESLRLTLARFEIEDTSAFDAGESLRAVAEFAANTPIAAASVAGVAVLYGAERDQLAAQVSAPVLASWRDALIEVMDWYGFWPARGTVGQHIVLLDAEPGATPALPAIEQRQITFDRAGYVLGAEATLFDLQGQVRPVAENSKPGGLLGWLRGLVGLRDDVDEVGDCGCDETPEEETMSKTVDVKPAANEEAVEETAAEVVAEETGTPAAEAVDIAAAVTEAVQAALAPYADALAGLQANASSERATLVERLTANSDLEASDLEALPTATLRKMAGAIKRPMAANYLGRAGAQVGDDDAGETVLTAPQLNGKKEAI